MHPCGVAALAKGYGHWLRAAPCLGAFGALCIRNYHLVGVLVAGELALEEPAHEAAATERADTRD